VNVRPDDRVRVAREVNIRSVRFGGNGKDRSFFVARTRPPVPRINRRLAFVYPSPGDPSTTNNNWTHGPDGTYRVDCRLTRCPFPSDHTFRWRVFSFPALDALRLIVRSRVRSQDVYRSRLVPRASHRVRAPQRVRYESKPNKRSKVQPNRRRAALRVT
jgi:hypothetical protein